MYTQAMHVLSLYDVHMYAYYTVQKACITGELVISMSNKR
jgi:hypothetical protein